MKILKFFFRSKKKKNSRISLLGQETLDIGEFIYFMGSLNCKDLKKMYVGRVFFGVPEIGGFGGVDDL